MYQKTYYIEKTTNTFADVLIAYGFAEVVYRILADADKDINLHLANQGNHYALKLSQALEPTWVENCAYFTVVPYILTAKLARQNPSPPMQSVDYEAETERNGQYFKQLETLRAARKNGDTPPEDMVNHVKSLQPRPDWPILAQVNQMSALNAYNSLVEYWYDSREHFAQHLKILLEFFATLPNDGQKALKQWKNLAKEHNLEGRAEVTATQVYNPANGKGSNRAKANALSIGGQKNFWMLEYLKLIGYMQAGIPRTVRGSKDRKTYVLMPKNITYNTHRRVFQRFQQNLWPSTAIKMDVLATLDYVITFIEQWSAGQLDELSLLFGGQPGDYVDGLSVVFYKYLGSAHAVLNQSTINLPYWGRELHTKQEAQDLLSLLEEHKQIVRNLEEKHSLEYQLLSSYRDFLSGQTLHPFFDFTAAYCSYLTHQIENHQPVTQFSTSNLEVLIMSQDQTLSPILENEGFQNIATAIRQSTVIAQRSKINGNRVYEVHYGLGNALKRAANYNDEFIQALTDFIHSYNQENVQKAETYHNNPPYRRKQVTTEDLEQIVSLVDRFGAKTIGSLLVAYGYARSPRTTEQTDTAVTEENADQQEAS